MRRSSVVVALFAAMCVLSGAACSAGTAAAGRAASRRAAATVTESATTPGDTGTQIPAGPDGARAAAIAYATASQDWLYLSDPDIDRAVRAIATPDAGPALAAQTVASLRTARDALARSSGRVWWLVRPLASRVEAYGGTSARVEVWTVTILSAAGVALPQADWMRVGVELKLVDGAWRVQAVDTTPGPTPSAGTSDRPWEAEPFDTALDGFQRVGDEAHQ